MELRSRLSDRQCRIYSAVAVAVLGAASLGTAVLQSSAPTTPLADSAPLPEVPVEHAPAEEFTPSTGLDGVDLLQPQAGMDGGVAAVPGAAMLPSAPGAAASVDPFPLAAPQGPPVPAFQAPAAAPVPAAPAPLSGPAAAPPPAQLPAAGSAAPAGPGAAPGGFQQAPPGAAPGGFQQAPPGAAPGGFQQAPPGAAPQQTTAPAPGESTVNPDGTTTEPEAPRRTGGAVGLLGLN